MTWRERSCRYCLRLGYAMSGTAMGLRDRYAISDTATGSTHTVCGTELGSAYALVMRCPVWS